MLSGRGDVRIPHVHRDGLDSGELLCAQRLPKAVHWGKGYATDASKVVLKRAFEVHKLERVLAITDFPNKASIRVMERLGMQFVERSMASGPDTLTYAISRKQFAQAGSYNE